MSYAIVHFLVGASLLLILAAPLALRFERVGDSALLLVTGGGIWALAPDIHHLAPVYQDQLFAVHQSPLTDVFAFHYMLDLDPVRDRPRIAIFVSLALFCLAAVVFTAAAQMGGRYDDRRVSIGTGTVGGILAAALVSMTILGAVFLSGGYLNSIGLLTGSNALFGWLLLAGGATAGAIGFGLFVELGPGSESLSPFGAAVVGSIFGAVAWLVGIVMALPIFLLRFSETSLSLAHVDTFTLVGFAVAGGALGSTYIVVTRWVSDGPTRRQDQFSLQR